MAEHEPAQPHGWHTQRMCAFDVETTGIDVDTDRIVTAAITHVGGGRPTTRPDGFPLLLDPGIDIPDQAARIHGITTAKARAEGQPAAEGAARIAEALADVLLFGTPLVGMNLAYDLTMLDRECARHGVTPPWERPGVELRVLDALVLDKQVDRYRPGRRNLGALCEQYEVRIDSAHDADADAVAAARVVWRIARLNPAIAALSLDELHGKQTHWAAQQAASLREHFTDKGQTDRARSVSGDWPLKPRPEGAPL